MLCLPVPERVPDQSSTNVLALEGLNFPSRASTVPMLRYKSWVKLPVLAKIRRIRETTTLTGTGSVSDLHTLNADPDPGLWLNTDPGSQYRNLILIKQKIFIITVPVQFFLVPGTGISQQQYLAAEPYVIFRKTYLK